MQQIFNSSARKQAGWFRFNSSSISNNRVTLTAKIQVKEMQLSANFYESVKKFYEIIQAKFSEVIVFKKQ